MKKIKYYQLRHIQDTQGFNYLKKENAEKQKNILNKEFGVFYVIDEMTLIFKDGD